MNIVKRAAFWSFVAVAGLCVWVAGSLLLAQIEHRSMKWAQQHERCLKAATNGLDIKRCG